MRTRATLYSTLSLAALSLALGGVPLLALDPAGAPVGSAAGAASIKTAVISVQGAVVGTKDGQKAQQELAAKFAPKQKEIEARQTELRQLQEQSQKGGSLMNEDKKAQLSRDIEEKNRRLQRDVQDAREEVNQDQQRLMQGIGQKMMAVIEKYAKDNGYSMVLDVSNPNTPVLYSAKSIDITEDIIGLYDKSAPTTAPTSNGSAQPTAAPSATPPAARPRPGTAAPRR